MRKNNYFEITGNLGQDLIEVTNNGKRFAVINVATDGESGPDWHRVEILRGYKELRSKLVKGALVTVSGSLSSRRRTDRILDNGRIRERTWHSQVLYASPADIVVIRAPREK